MTGPNLVFHPYFLQDSLHQRPDYRGSVDAVIASPCDNIQHMVVFVVIWRELSVLKSLANISDSLSYNLLCHCCRLVVEVEPGVNVFKLIHRPEDFDGRIFRQVVQQIINRCNIFDLFLHFCIIAAHHSFMCSVLGLVKLVFEIQFEILIQLFV